MLPSLERLVDISITEVNYAIMIFVAFVIGWVILKKAWQQGLAFIVLASIFTAFLNRQSIMEGLGNGFFGLLGL